MSSPRAPLTSLVRHASQFAHSMHATLPMLDRMDRMISSSLQGQQNFCSHDSSASLRHTSVSSLPQSPSPMYTLPPASRTKSNTSSAVSSGPMFVSAGRKSASVMKPFPKSIQAPSISCRLTSRGTSTCCVALHFSNPKRPSFTNRLCDCRQNDCARRATCCGPRRPSFIRRLFIRRLCEFDVRDWRVLWYGRHGDTTILNVLMWYDLPNFRNSHDFRKGVRHVLRHTGVPTILNVLTLYCCNGEALILPLALVEEDPASSEDCASSDFVMALYSAIPASRASPADFATAVAAALVVPFAPEHEDRTRETQLLQKTLQVRPAQLAYRRSARSPRCAPGECSRTPREFPPGRPKSSGTFCAVFASSGSSTACRFRFPHVKCRCYVGSLMRSLCRSFLVELYDLVEQRARGPCLHVLVPYAQFKQYLVALDFDSVPALEPRTCYGGPHSVSKAHRSRARATSHPAVVLRKDGPSSSRMSARERSVAHRALRASTPSPSALASFVLACAPPILASESSFIAAGSVNVMVYISESPRLAAS